MKIGLPNTKHKTKKNYKRFRAGFLLCVMFLLDFNGIFFFLFFSFFSFFLGNYRRPRLPWPPAPPCDRRFLFWRNDGRRFRIFPHRVLFLDDDHIFKKIIIEDSMSIHQEGSGNVPCFSFLFLTHTHKKKRDTENGSSDRLFYFTGQGNSFFIQWKKLNEKLRFKVDPICLQLADGVEEKTAVSQFLFDFYGTLWTRFFVCLFFFNRRTTRWTQSSSFFSPFFTRVSPIFDPFLHRSEAFSAIFTQDGH